jgi:hypothetical protein
MVRLEAVAHLDHPGNSRPFAQTWFPLYWKLVSKASGPIGRRPVSQEVHGLIFRMVADNPTWGPPRIHGELRIGGFREG